MSVDVTPPFSANDLADRLLPNSEPGSYSCLRDSSVRQVSDRLNSPLGECNSSPVAPLLSGSCPPAIFRFVVPVTVTPVESLSSRTFAHVCEEVFEHVPSIADRNSPSAVECEGRVVGVQASPPHRGPGPIGRRTVPCSFSAGSTPAPAPECGSGGEIVRACIAPPPTRALAFPGNPAAGVSSGHSHDGESAKYLADEIDDFSAHEKTVCTGVHQGNPSCNEAREMT